MSSLNPQKNKHLTPDKRIEIQSCLDRGMTFKAIAISRMLLVCIYHIIQTGECFNQSDYEEFQNPVPK